MMSSEGGNIIVWDINKEGMEKVAREIKDQGGKVWPYYCDVTDRQMIYKVAAEVKKDVGTVDILVNNAGVVTGKFFLDTPDEDVEYNFRINVLAHFWTTKAFLSDMIKKNDGHIVTISSAAGIIGVKKLSEYCSSKFANFGYNESLRAEFLNRKLNIRTLVVSPYYIDTGMFEGVKTRFPILLPILKQEKVANKIVEAIKKNRQRLIMPWIVYTVWLLRLFPVPFFDFVANFLGINNTMDDFVGRGGTKK